MSSANNQTAEIVGPLHSAKSILNAIALSLVFVGSVIIVGALALAITWARGLAIEGVGYLKSLVYEPLFGSLILIAGILVLRGMKKVESATKNNDPVDARSAMRHLASGACILAIATLLLSLFLFTEMWFMQCVSAGM